MIKKTLVRITTKPLALEKLLEGQLTFMSSHFKVYAISSDKNRLLNYGKNNNIEVIHLEMTRKITPLKDLLAVFKLIRILLKIKPDIVHSHTPKAGIIAMLASFIVKTPVRIHTIAGLPLMEIDGIKRKILELVEKFTYFLSTNVYVNSKGLKSFLLKNSFISKNKLRILCNGSTNGINCNYFSPNSINKDMIDNIRSKYKLTEEDFVFVFIGRIVRDKGVNEIISSFKKISKILDHIKLFIVGDYENDLNPISNESLSEIHSNNKIIFAGWQDDVRPYLMIAKVLLLPSYREGFPNVVLQAGAMETPSIVTNINGCNEIIKHNYNGLIIKKKNSEDLENAMFSLIKGKTLLSRLKKNSRKSIIKNYNQKMIWNLLLEEYSLILTEKN